MQAAHQSSSCPQCILCTVGFGGGISATTLLEFVESGRDIILAVDSDLSDDLRDLASDLGVDMETQGTSVLDHFHRAAGAGPDAVATTKVLQSKAVFGDRQPQVGSLRTGPPDANARHMSPQVGDARPSTLSCPLLHTHCQPWPPSI